MLKLKELTPLLNCRRLLKAVSCHHQSFSFVPPALSGKRSPNFFARLGVGGFAGFQVFLEFFSASGVQVREEEGEEKEREEAGGSVGFRERGGGWVGFEGSFRRFFGEVHRILGFFRGGSGEGG